jgi:UDP-3-O-[3-hydroxymyristoyl] glucosamine N-acyltransferase
MRNTIIVGSGAVAAEVTSYIQDSNTHASDERQLNILGYLEFEENISKYWSKYKFQKPVLSDIYKYNIQKDDHFIVAIANVEFRAKVIEILKDRKASIIGFIHCSVIIADSARLGIGNIIYPHCIIGPNATIGNNNLLTSYSFISHDCVVGDNNLFSTSGISGNVTVGGNNFFGIRATVLPNISIGDRNVIQAGMIVDKEVGNDSTVFHRFREKVIAIKSVNDQE